MKTISFTKDGYEKMLKEYEELKSSRVGAVAELRRAREMGDLSENAAYKVARQQVNHIDSRIRRLKYLKIVGRIVDRPFFGFVDINTKVTVQSSTGSTQFFITGDQEADPVNRKISSFSPIGKALMGKRKGDIVNVVTPSGTLTYTIIGVEG